MQTNAKARPLFDPEIVRGALVAAFAKLDPRHQIRNPVMFVVLIGSVLTTALFFQALAGQGEAPAGFILAVSLWLWFTVLFANFAEAMAEGRGKAQADALRKGSSRRSSPRRRATARSTPRALASRRRLARTFARATSSWLGPAKSSRATARSSSASLRSMRARSRARARR
jgi:K+-transporting ATPase ATPase B chain